MFDLIIKKAVCLLAHPENPDLVIEEKVDIGIKEGLISQIGSLYKAKAKEEFLANGLYVLPGLIDTQVHFREPGLEYKEDIYHGSLSAIKGGITAFFEMPNTSPPTINKQSLEDKIQIAKNKSWCDFAFYAGANKTNALQLSELEKIPACCGVKVFMGKSTGGLVVEDQKLLEQIISRNNQRATAIHSEDEQRLNQRQHLSEQEPKKVHNHLLWRDEQTALISTKRAVKIAEKYNKPIHILHISTKEEMEFIKNYRHLVSTEVTPQHLTFFAPDCYDKLGTLVQMNPPIRDKFHQQALWKAVREGLVDMLGSDHAPHTLEEKNQTYPLSPSGLPGTQTLLPLMLDHVNKGSLDLKLLVRLLAHNPAKRFKMKNQGWIKEGCRANLTLVDLKARRQIKSDWLASKCAWSPFEDWKVQGWPMYVFLHGKKVIAEDEVIGSPSGSPIGFN